MQRRLRVCWELPPRHSARAASSSSTLAPASRAISAAHKAALPPPITRTSIMAGNPAPDAARKSLECGKAQREISWIKPVGARSTSVRIIHRWVANHALSSAERGRGLRGERVPAPTAGLGRGRHLHEELGRRRRQRILLLQPGLRRRRQRRRRDRHRDRACELRPSTRTASSPSSCASTRRPHAQPRRAVQRRDQVQGVPGPCHSFGAEKIATGHYARVRWCPANPGEPGGRM